MQSLLLRDFFYILYGGWFNTQNIPLVTALYPDVQKLNLFAQPWSWMSEPYQSWLYNPGFSLGLDTLHSWFYLFCSSRNLLRSCQQTQRQSCKPCTGLTIRAKKVGGWRPLLFEIFLSTWPRWSEIADFRSLFARSDSAVTPGEKSSINTNRKSTTRFPMNPRWTSYVVPKPPKGGSKRKVSEIWTISCDTSETVRDISVTINH